jgi:hypothetical protein
VWVGVLGVEERGVEWAQPVHGASRASCWAGRRRTGVGGGR